MLAFQSSWPETALPLERPTGLKSAGLFRADAENPKVNCLLVISTCQSSQIHLSIRSRV
jgi:hypothetical protein